MYSPTIPAEHTGSDPDHVAPFQFFRTGVDQQNVFELAFGQRDEVVHLLVRNDQRHLGRLVVHALGRDQLGRLDFLKPRRRDSHEDQVMDGGLPDGFCAVRTPSSPRSASE